MVLFIWIILAVVAFIVLMFVTYYNKFVVLGNRIDNSLAQIDVQLRKRGELVPNLIETVKGYVKHEKRIIDSVTSARKAFVGAATFEGRLAAGKQLQQAIGGLFAIAENYPNLKANENFLQLQQELASIEDKIAYSRQFYNDSILDYNNSVQAFPGVIFAKIYNRHQKAYLQIPEETKAVPKIKFE
ncbi:MAG: LemA family protein [Nanoarchaeota archaeon]